VELHFRSGLHEDFKPRLDVCTDQRPTFPSIGKSGPRFRH
jgi:hypothetical protein